MLKSLTEDIKQLDKRIIAVFILIPLCLIFIRYLGETDYLIETCTNLGYTDLSNTLSDYFKYNKNSKLYGLIYWIITIDICYLLIPVLFIRFVLKDKVSNYAFSIKLEKNGLKLYLLMLVIMIPLVLYFSTTKSFQDRYPFYNISGNEALWPKFWTWELFYLSHFFALEFFFRGFMLNSLKGRFGMYSIFIMCIPYCMIHFGKPMPETIAAIVAGIVLGYLSLRSNSIFLGFLIHVSVALTMDMAALWREGYFG